MQEPLQPPIRWPGFAPDRAFILPLPADAMTTPFGHPCAIDGLRLARKSEFHVTVLSRAMSRLAVSGCGEASIRSLYESLVWTPRRSGRYVLLHDTTRKPESWSLIEHLELPAMLAFRAALERRLGPVFADPVPHVTHYVSGDAQGIGVPDRVTLEVRFVRDVEPPR